MATKYAAGVLLGISITLNCCGTDHMGKDRYIALMEKILYAYSNEHIDDYYNSVKRDGLKEHGFPRLTANIGILLAHNKRSDLRNRFVKMMDLCCQQIPLVKRSGNEFSIREIVFALLELEKNKSFPPEQIECWKSGLKRVTVENCYRVYAVEPDSKVSNWAAFAMSSEWMRYYIKAASADEKFIDIQAASQLQALDDNGMYRDPGEPMVYDLVPRGLFAVLFHFGYRGKYFEMWDDALKRAGLHTLKMLSVTGEIPYGGRSNQFLYNEALTAIIAEYEANRYFKLGDIKTASQFKTAVKRNLDSIELWLNNQPINHVKNFFPRSSGYGCEKYAYFDKYMITAASYLFTAYLLSDDNIPVGTADDLSGESFQTTDHFHKLFLRAGEYFTEYDYRADYKYDASGLGRLHRKGAPSAISLSTPGTDTPNYEVNADDAVAFSIVPQVMYDGIWLSGADRDAVHKIVRHESGKTDASAVIDCIWQNKEQIRSSYLLNKDGLQITVSGKGAVGLMIPAFSFDGKENTQIICRSKTLAVQYKNWQCVYELTAGTIVNTGKTGYNRNGHYKLFRAVNDGTLTVKISISKY